MVAPGGSATDRARRVAKASAVLGALAWLALLLTGPHDAVVRWNVERWVQLAVLVYVPAVLWFVGGDVAGEDTADADAGGANAAGDWLGRTYRVGVWLQPVGAACVVASAFVASTPLRGALAAAWVGVTGVLATLALLRAREHGVTPLSALLVDAAFAYAVVGAVALVLSRLGITFRFSAAIIHLTAIHYHYAGFVLPVVAGLTGRYVERAYPDGSVRRETFRATGAVVLAGMVVIAVGITASPLVEVVSVAFFTVAVAAFAALSLSLLPRIVRDAGGVGGGIGTARVAVASALLVVASASVVVTMAFAVGYGWSAYTGETVVSLSTMIAWHGTVNAVGFAAAGLGAWFLLAPDSCAERVDAPLSRLRSRWRVGADYSERTGVAGARAAGEMDDLDAFARENFDTARVAPAVRAFYERTSEYRLGVTADWHRPFRTGAAVAAPVTSAVEQLNLPGPREHGTVRVLENELFAVADDTGGAGAAWVDDRIADARVWLRTDVDTDDAVFVAVYGSHEADGSHVGDDGDRDVNIAVPLPGATLSTVLRMDALELADRDGVGVALTTRAPGHPGLYLSPPGVDVRLPIHQTFRVWPADATPADDGPTVDVTRLLDAVHEAGAGDAADEAPAAVAADGASTDDVVVATHEMWLWGRRFLTLRYVGVPTAAP